MVCELRELLESLELDEDRCTSAPRASATGAGWGAGTGVAALGGGGPEAARGAGDVAPSGLVVEDAPLGAEDITGASTTRASRLSTRASFFGGGDFVPRCCSRGRGTRRARRWGPGETGRGSRRAGASLIARGRGAASRGRTASPDARRVRDVGEGEARPLRGTGERRLEADRGRRRALRLLRSRSERPRSRSRFSRRDASLEMRVPAGRTVSTGGRGLVVRGEGDTLAGLETDRVTSPLSQWTRSRKTLCASRSGQRSESR